MDNRDIGAWQALCAAFVAKGDAEHLNGAKTNLEATLKLDAKEPTTNRMYVETLLRLGKLDDAEKASETYAKADKDSAMSWYLRGVIHGCHFFAPKMAERRSGHVVNISSILGIFPAPNVTAYVASKFAVLGFSQSLRSELRPHGVGVTAICPGMIATAIVADSRMSGAGGDRKARAVEQFKKGTPPAKVAEVILDAVRTNPVLRTVGRDAWVVHQLTKLAPQSFPRVSVALQQWFGREP